MLADDATLEERKRYVARIHRRIDQQFEHDKRYWVLYDEALNKMDADIPVFRYPRETQTLWHRWYNRRAALIRQVLINRRHGKLDNWVWLEQAKAATRKLAELN